MTVNAIIRVELISFLLHILLVFPLFFYFISNWFDYFALYAVFLADSTRLHSFGFWTGFAFLGDKMLPLGIFSLCTFYLNFFVLRTCFYIFKEMSFKKEVGSNFWENSSCQFYTQSRIWLQFHWFSCRSFWIYINSFRWHQFFATVFQKKIKNIFKISQIFIFTLSNYIFK